MLQPDVSLDDKYLLPEGRIYLSGVQALVRLPLMQRRCDLAAGLNTAGFISGYRGSPLGTLDQQLWKARQHLAAHHVHFEPGLNEELAATAVWGSQQTNLYPGAKYDGVFAMWYGKAPGVDRAGDALRHGNAAGASAHGGVLALLGDDHNCKSASLPSQSEYACIHAMIPVLNPAGVADLIDLGLLGWALSRFSGAWVGLKCLIDTMDVSVSVEVGDMRALPVIPADFKPDPRGLNLRWPDPPLEQERRQHEQRMQAIHAFARANRFDYAAIDPAGVKRLGIVTTGKSYLDTRQALHELGITPQMAGELGIGLYKVGMSWPLDATGARRFASGFETVIVIEEKRGVIEEQLAHALYGLPESVRPRLLGKTDENGAPLFQSAGELSVAQIARELGRRVLRWYNSTELGVRLARIEEQSNLAIAAAAPNRLPYFCPGCPHNTSTTVPKGSRAIAGIGCHYMAQWMDRRTETFTQMGAKGTSWIGQAPFTNTAHVFVNIGDGTFAHSGSLAVRAARAAGVNITYKLLYNDVVAMTGGQPAEGRLTVPQIVGMLKAEGVAAIRVVTDDPGRYPPGSLPSDVPVLPRTRLDAVQRELRDIRAVTVLIYDQTCAAELRRRRKRKLVPTPNRRVLINEQVCEGCGDCGLQSNCVAIVPKETSLGRKRQIDQSSCNQDFSCVRGFCPSFVTVIGESEKAPRPRVPAAVPEVPLPDRVELTRNYGIVIAGIGGTGVVTIGALIGMAAHIERKGVSVLDMIGLAQKGGQVLSQIWLTPQPESILATRIPTARADLLIGCDLIVSASRDALALLDPTSASAIINSHATMPAQFTRNPDEEFPGDRLRQAIAGRLDELRIAYVDATDLAVERLGEAMGANVFLLGYAWQKGLIPLSREALLRAIELNGTAVEANKAAFEWGRHAAHISLSRRPEPQYGAEELDERELIAQRAQLLTHYQSASYAQKYESLVSRALEAESERAPGKRGLARAAAESLYRLMAYKDEYEVARLFVQTDFLERVRASFGRDVRMRFHLAPPLLARWDAVSGRPRKLEFGGWMVPLFHVLASLRKLRGTPLDIFGYTAERRMERELVRHYMALIEELIGALNPDNHALAVQIASLPAQIRGFGPVKEQARARVGRLESELLAAFRKPREVRRSATAMPVNES